MHRAVYLALLIMCFAVLNVRAVDARQGADLFEAKIRPVLMGTCFECHGATKVSGGLRVDSRQALIEGGDSGAAILPGQPETSLLIRAIQRHEDVSAMPPDEKKSLRADQVSDFVAWIKAGAEWPANSAQFESTSHWAYEPIRDAPQPKVKDKTWQRNSIDAFVRSKQEAIGFRPAPRADRITLIRRATFDLTGLPPTPKEIEAFLNDASPNAFEKLVNRLLEAPAYGEHWGRHWLDVVRYADTAGETADYPVPQAWRYRNYVIESFQSDKPYDEFLREQIAGDVLAGNGPNDKYAERVTATGFLAISRRFGFDSENYHHLTIQDSIDTLGQTFLGLSLGCARCHDHKFDPLSMDDYYGLYGILDSSRYPFPGSEQKQKLRLLVPLSPPAEARTQWRDYRARVAALSEHLAKLNQPVPVAVLRSLAEIDGDFELQAPAAGGSNGVLVPPWLYHGNIAVTNSAQSPFKNLYPGGKVGASVRAGGDEYRLEQALKPGHTAENCDQLFVNLDFRVAAAAANAIGLHRFSLSSGDDHSAVELLISPKSLSIRTGDQIETVSDLETGEWHNLQLSLNLDERTFSGTVGAVGWMTEFKNKQFSPNSTGVIDFVSIGSIADDGQHYPAIEFDNLGVQETPIAVATTEWQNTKGAPEETDPATLSKKLSKQLLELAGNDGDLELQTDATPPVSPWNPGPNSVAKVSSNSQSPFRNIFPEGKLGIHMPNRANYDGFGLTISDSHPDDEGRLQASFDFRCANMDAGGEGSWRWYLGHGPGNSAAVELFFNGEQFFRKGGNKVASVCNLEIGKWYQVQLTLDLKKKIYQGQILSTSGNTRFEGPVATGWDGTIDYLFIDSYGHVQGTRPALDADNFSIGHQAFSALEETRVEIDDGVRENRIALIAQIKQQLAALAKNVETRKRELNTLLADGPYEMAYAMAEGTPHNVKTHIRGEPDQLGTEVPRGFLKILGGGPLPSKTGGSGRLELADWMIRSDNPLTARVMVNRIWQYHFGRGLVKTPNDFGVRGLRPTHPELLDHLATEFVQGGWSVKAMHRLIMSSATYQQASVTSEADSHRSAETENLNLADYYIAFARRRLNAEEIRDSILAVTGQLDQTPGEAHPFPSPLQWGYTQHAPFAAVYDHNKRSIYLMTQRLRRHPFLALFDGADPNATTANRLTTTVPTQALYFLNDPFVHAMAEKWAERLMKTSSEPRQRIERSYRHAFGRFPTEVEITEALAFLAEYRAELTGSSGDIAGVQSLAAYLRTLIGSNEFLYVD